MILIVSVLVNLIAIQHLLKYTKIDAISQKNMIRGSFRSLLKGNSVCLRY